MSAGWPVSALLLVRPARFGYNPENADNVFGRPGEAQGARQEFEAVLAGLRALGMRLLVLDDTSASPDAIFPNNWFSTHPDGTLFLYPMKAPSRRTEVRSDLRERLAEAGFETRRIIDLTPLTDEHLFLEGTGSLVLDPLHQRAYAALSERCHPEALQRWASLSGYTPVPYTPIALKGPDGSSHPIYHTNVLQTIGPDYALWCPEAIKDEAERAQVQSLLSQDRRLIELSLAQVMAFAGNMLAVTTPSGPCLLMSQSARESLSQAQVEALSPLTRLASFPIPTIERIGGGSLRCMLGEIARVK